MGVSELKSQAGPYGCSGQGLGINSVLWPIEVPKLSLLKLEPLANQAGPKPFKEGHSLTPPLVWHLFCITPEHMQKDPWGPWGPQGLTCRGSR